mmetsp:Transcript_16878/g.25419  ORF Transcript_16878/g.25419 Transcript_16878/m.25419 type:complete len:368 (+) Transcript_16878:184-1287(+)|eukprot:CAMPEP_0185038252 /NCGR_PEP_ID=MMETSP1103-20130426/33685_1 /TAXON_ID=36769 /ORGANISM="Paraphysomonas bandaiensis, Strain Caron Lab Isolate" /LENGTH=367 /DNA_ID=CAMNT_0027576603 /DNA_START=98 /DNA_END=1201 /DNA_ORIENTATION=+
MKCLYSSLVILLVLQQPGSSIAVPQLMEFSNTSSKCYGAVDFKKYGHYCKNIPKYPRLQTLKVSDSRILLKIISIGPGTTGTRTIYSALCSVLHIRAWHYNSLCKEVESADFKVVKRMNGDVEYFETPRSGLLKITDALMAIRRSAPAIVDTPASELFIDLSLSTPNAAIILSMRDPKEWALRRATIHAHETVICDRKLWDLPGVLHPFDFVGCLQSCRSCSRPLVSLHEYIYGQPFSKFHKIDRTDITPAVAVRLKTLEEAYVRMNTVHACLASKRDFLPVCLWDIQNFTIESFAENLRQFILGSHISPSFSGLTVHEYPPDFLIPQKTRIKHYKNRLTHSSNRTKVVIGATEGRPTAISVTARPK